MKTIPLTQGRVALVSDQDWFWLSQYKWYAHRINRCWYARTNIRVGFRQRNIKMHRLLLGFPTCRVDHRNCNGLDNRRCNLRRASNQQNVGNRRRNLNNKSGVKGVHWHKVGNAWCAKIGQNGKRIHLGLFKTRKAAARAYAKAAKKWFGNYARL